MIIKEYGIRSLKYIKRYPKHYAGYALFGTGFYFLANYCRHSENEIIRIGFAGSIASFVTEIIFHPIDVINTKTKAEIAHKDMNSYKMIRRIFHKEGIFGFWRGASCTYYGSLIGGLIYFSSYKQLKIMMTDHDNKSNNNHIHFFAYLFSSLLGELPHMLIYYPFDLIRTRLEIRAPAYKYQGIRDGARQITNGKLKNIKRLYVGATPSFILNISNTTIMFTVLESLREYFIKHYKLTSVNQLPRSVYLFCSITAGIISGALTNIMEVVTIHKQVDPKFKFLSFLKEQGVKALKQGLFARVSINVLHCVTLFFVVDEVSKIFNVEL
jgi:hypothetical protein